MKRFVARYLFSVAAVAAAAALPAAAIAAEKSEAAPCAHEAHAFRCVQYVKNYDADTITFDIPGVHPLIGDSISVRLFGLDTPEIRGKTACEKEKAKEARDFVTGVLKRAKRIDLEQAQKDKYFRILAEVIVDGKPLNELLFARGYAYPYFGETKAKVDWCGDISRLPAAAAPKRKSKRR